MTIYLDRRLETINDLVNQVKDLRQKLGKAELNYDEKQLEELRPLYFSKLDEIKKIADSLIEDERENQEQVVFLLQLHLQAPQF